MALILSQTLITAIKAAIRTVSPFTTQGNPDTEKVALFVNDIVPGKDHVIADFDFATYTGSAPKALADEFSVEPIIDPVSGKYIFEVPQAVGGLSFLCTAAPAETETVYGYVITNDDGTIVYASERFADQVPISAAGQGVNIGDITAKFPVGFASE